MTRALLPIPGPTSSNRETSLCKLNRRCYHYESERELSGTDAPGRVRFRATWPVKGPDGRDGQEADMPTENTSPAHSVSITDLQPLAERLNSASDDLNQALKRIETALVALNVGLEVWVELRPEEPCFLDEDTAEHIGERPGFSWTRQLLGVHRSHPSGEWRLQIKRTSFVEHNNERAEGVSTFTDLLQASREDRLAAVAKIPDLLAAVRDKASAALDRIERARELADSLTDDIPF